MTSIDTFDVLTMTDEARNVVLDALAGEAPSDALALWVEVTGTQGRGLHLRPLFLGARTWRPSDAAMGRDGEMTIVVPAASVDRLRGEPTGVRKATAAVDSCSSIPTARPPRRPTPDCRPRSWPTASGAHRARWPWMFWKIKSIRPIASHGGRADLVATGRGEEGRLHQALGRLSRLRHESHDLVPGY